MTLTVLFPLLQNHPESGHAFLELVKVAVAVPGVTQGTVDVVHHSDQLVPVRVTHGLETDDLLTQFRDTKDGKNFQSA